MNSSSVNIQNVSHLKCHLQKILRNLKKLDELKKSVIPDDSQIQLASETESLICWIEKEPLSRFVQSIKKRRNKRRRRKNAKLKHTSTSKNIPYDEKQEEVVPATPPTKEENLCKILEDSLQLKQNEFHQKKCHTDAQRFLQTFELLEMLHYARSQDKIQTQIFREDFTNLRHIWNNILLENTPKRTEARRIEDQWNEVLFGANEQIYYKGKKSEHERLKEFFQIRRTWDSYLVRNKNHGSSIPVGWVLPCENAQNTWTQFKTQ